MAEYDADNVPVYITRCEKHGDYLHPWPHIIRIAVRRCPKCGPWIPDPEEFEALRKDLDFALRNDFRIMVQS